MQLPNKTQYIQQIKSNIPPEILADNIWLAYYFKKQPNGKYTKPPLSSKGYSVEKGSKGVSFEKACKDGYPGILITEHTPYIAFDIDDELAKKGKRKFSLVLLSAEFREFLEKYPSYTELSPSGCGLRVLVKCSNKEVMTDLPGRLILDKDKCIGGELFVHSGYVTITGKCIKNSKLLTTLRDVDILLWANLKKKTEKTDVPAKLDNEFIKLPNIKLVERALDVCKLDQSDRVKQAYENVINQGYIHYDYWLRILAACKDYALKSGSEAEMLEMVDNWSKTDELAYQGIDDVINHWDSLDEKKFGTTYKTLFKLARLLEFNWPVPAYDKKGNPTGGPTVNVPENFEYLMKHLGIEILEDVFTNQKYLYAPESIRVKHLSNTKKRQIFGFTGPFTEDELRHLMWSICQSYGYLNSTLTTISPLFKSFFYNNVKEVNIMERWLNTEYKDLPYDMKEPGTDIENSTLDYLMSCITFNEDQDIDLTKKFFDTFFYEMMMPIYNTSRKYAQRSFMLVLIGPEACRKTTFLTMLFPPQLRETFITQSIETLGGAKSMRDFANSLVSSALVIIDEFEIFYNKKNDSLFKNYVTTDVIDYVPIYSRDVVKKQRNAVLAGTTNKTSLPFEQDNNRRLALVRIKWVDTDAVAKINWHTFYRHYAKLGTEAMTEGKFPWKLSDEVIQKQYELNEDLRSQSNLEIILRELFDFGMHTHKKPLDFHTITNVQADSRLYKLRDVQATIIQSYPGMLLNLAEMKHTLKRLCGKYTKTTNKKIDLEKGTGFIDNGVVKSGQWTKYPMPPRLTDFKD